MRHMKREIRWYGSYEKAVKASKRYLIANVTALRSGKVCLIVVYH